MLFLLSLLFVSAGHAQPAEPASVRVAVLSLFHPQTLVLTREGSPPLRISRTPDGLVDVESPSGAHRELAKLVLSRSVFTLQVQGTRTSLLRTYHGALSVEAGGGELRPIVPMETEAAVAPVVLAESPPGAPAEFLRAQAIAARSFLLANLHPGQPADTCDTTHCQLLQGLPPAGSPAARATAETAHLVLVWRPDPASPPRVVAAQWTASCSGRTVPGHPRTPEDYPFPPVACAFCRAHPDRWTLPPDTPVPADERAREAWNKAHPERAVPSLALARDGGGQGRGHGSGLCQRGAAALAARGETARELLAHFYPNTTVEHLP